MYMCRKKSTVRKQKTVSGIFIWKCLIFFGFDLFLGQKDG